MAQHYSDPKRTEDPHALPNLETFETRARVCNLCNERTFADPITGTFPPDMLACETCGDEDHESEAGWYYWYCFPGCLPDSDPIGPFATEAEALADARDGVEE